jgi:hypothetical protein
VRGQAAAGARGSEHARAAKELRLKVRDLEQDMVGLRRTETAHRELLQRSQCLETQNTSLRQQARETRGGGGGEIGGGGGDAAGRALAAARADAAAAANELAETREALLVQRAETDAARADAERALAVADQHRPQNQQHPPPPRSPGEATHVAHGAARRVAAAETEAARLRGENADLRAELDALGGTVQVDFSLLI